MGEVIQAKSKRSIKLTKKSGLIVIILLTILIGSGVFAYTKTMTDKSYKAGPAGSNATESDAQEIRPNGPIEAAEVLAVNGDYAGAQQALQTELDNSTDNSYKASVLVSMSNLAYNAEKYKDALDFAQKSEGFSPTKSSATLIAMSAEKLNNKKLAIEYYKKVIERINPESPLKEAETQEFQGYINALGGAM